MRTSLRRRGGRRGTAEPGCCARIGVRASARQNRMQFKNTSDVTVRTDTNKHTTGGELHAKLGGDEQQARTQSPQVWRRPEGPEGLAAVPVGGGGAWQGYSQRPSPTGVEGTGGSGGPGRGAGGWRQGQGGPRDRPLRAFRLACGDLAGGPPPTGTHSSPAQQGTQSSPAQRADGASGTRNTRGAHKAALRNWAASRPTAQLARSAILKSPGHPQCRRRNAPRARQATPR